MQTLQSQVEALTSKLEELSRPVADAIQSVKATKSILYTICVHQGDNLAPLLFNIFFQAALDSLDSVWDLELPKFRFFPTAKSGKPRGRLGCQQIAHGKEFSFGKSLYVDDGQFQSIWDKEKSSTKRCRVLHKLLSPCPRYFIGEDAIYF